MSTALADFKARSLRQFEAFEASLNGQKEEPIHQLRQAAARKLESLDFPTTKHEEWKYTNVKAILDKEYADTPGEATEAELAPYLFGGLEANLLVFVNGRYAHGLSKVVSPEEELILLPLEEAYRRYPQALEANFGQRATIEGEPFTALNAALFRDGLFALAKRGKDVQTPILILHLADARQADVMAQPRNLFVCEENSRLTVIERFAALGEGSAFFNAVTEASVASYAHFDHYRLQAEGDNVHQVTRTEAYQYANSTYRNNVFSLSGGMIRNNLGMALDGEHCETYMNGLYMLDGKTHVDNHTAVDHRMPNSYSDQLYKGLMDGRSRGVFNGKIFVRQDAQKTNAFQNNRNLLLSENASVDTKPQLEIWADDVKCSHGATIGQLDKEPLFYLRSRGIPERQAKSLLMLAFAADVFERIQVAPVREAVERAVHERLGVEE